MASRNLGTLTLDLVAKIGGFTGPMDQATRQSQKRMKEIQNSARNTADSIKAIFGALAIGAVLTKVISETQQAEKEQAQLAAVLRSTGEAAGYNRDQLNSMADALEGRSIFSAGDITQAQTTLLAFTNVVGDEFQRAMQSVLDMSARTGQSIKQTAETIGRALDTPSEGYASLTRQGFRFKEDQKKVIEALEATGRTAEAQKIILEALESSYSGAAQAARDTFGGSLEALRNTVNGLLTGDSGSLETARLAIEDLNASLSDPQTKAAFSALVSTVVSGSKAIVGALPFIIDAGDGVVRVFDSLGNTIINLYSTAVGRIQNLAASVSEALSILPDFAGGAGFAEQAAEYRREAQLNLDIAAQAAEKIRQNLETPLAGTAAVDAALRKIEALEKQGVAANGTSDAIHKLALAEVAAAEAQEKSAKAAQKNAEQIAKQIQFLQFQANTVGMTSDAVTLLRLELDGATDAQIAQAAAALNTVNAYEAQADAIQKLNDAQEATNKEAVGILNSLMSEEDQLRQSYERRKQIILDATLLTEEQRQEALRGLQENFDEEMLELNGSFWEKYLKAAEKNLANFDELASNMTQNFSRRFGDAFESVMFDAETLEDAFKGLAEGMARSIVSAIGEMAAQWLAYQAVQLLVGKTGQAAAAPALIANAQATAMQASLAAFASTAAIPIVGPGLAPAAAATAAAATTPMVAGISAAALAGMAHDGIDSVPETGTWLLQKGERVTTADTSAKLDRTLDSIQQGGAGGGSGMTVYQTFEINGPVGEEQIALARKTMEDTVRLLMKDANQNGPIMQTIRRRM